MNQNAPTVTLYGNAGGDAENILIEGKGERTFETYDPILDDVVVKTAPNKDKTVVRFSLAVGGYTRESDGVETPLRWISCTDWNDTHMCRMVRKGCRVRVTGTLTTKEVEKDGETVTYRNLALQSVQILKRPAAKPRDTEEQEAA